MQRINVGIDIAQEKFDACFFKGDYKSSKIKTYQNNQRGFHTFVNDFKNLFPDSEPYILFESTGNYMRDFQIFIASNAFNYMLLNARIVKKYSQFLNMQGKTDAKDSYMLAHLAASYSDEKFITDYNFDTELLSKYNSLLNFVTNLKQKLMNFNHSIDYGSSSDIVDGILSELKLALTTAQKELKKISVELLSKVYPVTKIIDKEVTSVSGSLLLSLVPLIYDSVGHYTKSQITALVGMNPTQYQSGKYKGKDRLNMFGNKQLKRSLFMSALSASRFNPVLAAKHKELVEGGKSKKSSIIILMRKILLLVIAYILKDKRERGLLLHRLDNKVFD